MDDTERESMFEIAINEIRWVALLLNRSGRLDDGEFKRFAIMQAREDPELTQALWLLQAVLDDINNEL